MSESVSKGRTRYQPLTEAAAAQRLTRFGANELTVTRRRSVLAIIGSTLREPMFALLLIAASLYLVLGDWHEGLLLVAGACLSMSLVIVQEARNETALAALRTLAAPTACVLRSSGQRRIPARELVPQDFVLIGEGERVPVDALLIDGDVLTVDESILTGESVPVIKTPVPPGLWQESAPQPGEPETPFLFAGTLVLRGQGMLLAMRTGHDTALGRIGESLAAIEPEPSHLQKSMARLIGWLGAVGLGFCGLVALAYGLVRGNWIEGGLAGITLAIAMTPEEFPMVFMIFMAIGSWRLAQTKVLVRRAAVVETLGATSMLCVDKTGTLTENRMEVAALWQSSTDWRAEADVALPSRLMPLLDLAVRASSVAAIDPMDRALRGLHAERDHSATAATPIRTFPLRPGRLAFIQIWREPQATLMAAAKGAPETIFDLCRLIPEQRRPLIEVIKEMAGKGLRVLAVAHCDAANDDALATEEALTQAAFSFDGLVGFRDPVRSDVPAAIAQARRAGIAVAMITGDYPATAMNIARQAGLDTFAGVLTGPEIAAMDSSALQAAIRETRVFARIQPEQKLGLVNAFKADGHVVAMTGDGVNDAPALEAAHVGIAMAQRGTDVAREASDIVLLDDSFASIIGGIRLGRRIFVNLRKALTYITAIHVPVGGLALLPIVAGLPPILLPVHVMILELIIDPMSALVFEGEPSDRQAMMRPPRPVNESLFGLGHIFFGLLLGSVMLAAVFALYWSAIHASLPEQEARAIAYVALVLGNLTLAFATSRDASSSFFGKNRIAFWAIAAAAVAIVGLAIFVAPIATLFRFSPPNVAWLGLAVLVALLAGGWSVFVRTFLGGSKLASAAR